MRKKPKKKVLLSLTPPSPSVVMTPVSTLFPNHSRFSAEEDAEIFDCVENAEPLPFFVYRSLTEEEKTFLPSLKAFHVHNARCVIRISLTEARHVVRDIGDRVVYARDERHALDILMYESQRMVQSTRRIRGVS